MTDRPILLQYDGDGMFKPASKYWASEAEKRWAIGETVAMVEHHPRSHKTHAHFFAQIHDYWQHLPETLADQYPNSEVLRKRALIATGYADERSIVCASKAEAIRVAAFIRPMDDYAIVITSGPVVKVFTAKSQSVKAMGAKEFQASKQAVLDHIAALLSVPTSELVKAGEAA